ncbi:class I SAM-dependent methyltransferase [Micromonospora sp. NPDC051196]|uniref:class I SAM-dependent methyltransferase n=1 Tax=Micromonospora sp. NPDC051196 TaxID=3155281 RepID=UPI00341ED469
MEYGPDHAELYDIVFRSRGKDFNAEAEEHTRLIRSRLPAARTLLDVACGTGAHLETFAKLFDRVEGLELTPAMRDVATRRLPGVTVHPGNMVDFDLGRTYDAVVCIGNAVASVATAQELSAAIGRMAAHLVPGGVLLIEPWWFPDNFIDGYISTHLAEEKDRVISRISVSTRQGDRSRIEINSVVADASGLKGFTDVLSVGLFTQDEYEQAFRDAGCTVERLHGLRLGDGRPTSPGIFVGTRR